MSTNTPTRPHAAKVRALLAYEVDALSADGRTRVEAHLRGCDVCRGELASMRLYDNLSAEVRAAEVPALSYSRMEFTLRREARRQTQLQTGSGKTAAWAVLALAAAVALGVLGLRQRGMAPQTASLPVHQPAVAAIALPDSAVTMPNAPLPSLEGAATLVADARIRDQGASLDSILREGDVLETGPEGALHGRLAPGTGFALAADSKVTLRMLRPDGILLDLDHGNVSSAVKTGTHYAVNAGAYRVVVRGTRFNVRRVGEHVHVSLAEGTVAIEARGAPDGAPTDSIQTIEVLHAPAEWDSSEAGPPQDRAMPVAVTMPVALDADVPWPGVTLPPFPYVEAWELSGARYSAAGELALRAPVGTLTLSALDARGRARVIQLEVLPEGAHLTEAMLPRQVLGPARGELDPADISRVVRARQRALRRCYERVLRQRGDPSLTQAAYTLRVDVGVRGDVRRVRLTASVGEPNEALADCITHEVRGWTFPRPRGGPVSFSLPLNLSAR